MGKAILSFFFLALLALSNVADATVNVKLVAQNQRSSSGTRSTLVWKDCGPTGTGSGGSFVAPCLDPRLAWNITNGVTGSDATWVWTPDAADATHTNGTLQGTGLYWSSSFISSQPGGTSVVSDKATNLKIDTSAQDTTYDIYDCVEGTFLAGVHASGCNNTDLGFNSIDDSISQWNVPTAAFPGGDPYCVTLEIVGDDFSLLDGHAATVSPPQDFFVGTPNPRGGHAVVAGARGTSLADGTECAATSGGFDLWTVVDLSVETGAPRFGYPDNQLLVLSNGTPLCTLPVDIACEGANWMTFAFAPTSADDRATALQAAATPIDVLANDTYATPTSTPTPISFTDPVTVTVATQPGHGTATVTGSPGPAANVRISYTSAADYECLDSFTYHVVDANGDSDSATAEVNVLAPGANCDPFEEASLNVIGAPVPYTPEDIAVAANDLGFTDPVTITIVSAPDQGGTAVPSAPGPVASAFVTFTPQPRAAGSPAYTEHLTYQITDGTVTDTAVVTIQIQNLVPHGLSGSINSITTQGVNPVGRSGFYTAGTGGSLGDPPFVVVIETQPTRGTATFDDQTNRLTYTITDPTFFEGVDTFTYSSTDKDGETEPGVVTVNIVNLAPKVADTAIFLNQGTTASAPIQLGIIAGNGQMTQHTATVTAGAHGACTFSGVGTSIISLSYTPSDSGFTGTDSCVVTAVDADGTGPVPPGRSGTVTITVQAAAAGGDISLPGGSSAIDPWSLSLLAGAWALRRRSRVGDSR